MVGTSKMDRATVGVSGALLALGCGALWSGCGADRSRPSEALALAGPGHGPAERARPGARLFPRFEDRHGFSFGPHGIPGGHGFRGHGRSGRCDGGGRGGGGAAGTTGAGGSGGSGGMSGGLGGTGGAPPMVCSGTPPAAALITDFSDAVAGTSGIAFGTPPGLGGGTFTYAATGLNPPVLSLAPAPAGSTGQALQVVANPGLPTDPADEFSGFGLGFDMCVDASAYTGVEFTITGDLGSCALTFAAQFSEDNSVTDDPSFGSCTLGGNCFPPSSGPIVAGTTVVHFADLLGGSPQTSVDARALTGVQWNLDTNPASPCSASFAVTDIRFINDAGAGGSGGIGGGRGGGPGSGGRAGGPDGGAPPPLKCAGSPPSSALITGSIASPVGGTFTFSAPGLAAPTVLTTAGSDGSLQSLQVTATPGVSLDPANAFSGFGLFFTAPACLDAALFDGVQFTVSGDLGTCSLNVFLVPSEDNAVANGPFGTCAATSCVGPFSMPVGTGTNLIHFSDLGGGSPDATLDPTALNDIGWTLDVPTDGVTAPCSASFTIADVAFVSN
jgi:hypothetical protein